MNLSPRFLNVLCWLLIAVCPSGAFAEGEFLERKTFSELLENNAALVVGRQMSPATVRDSDRKGWGHANFQVVDVLKGSPTLGEATLEARVRTDELTDGLLLLRATQANPEAKLNWRVSQPVTEAYRQHLLAIAKLESNDTDRLAFYENYLHHDDEDISANAHLEYWRASDESFAEVSRQMDRTKIVGWLHEPNTPIYRQRLYLAMLARCGSSEDIAWLEEKVRNGSGQRLLDAWIGCYLMIKGTDGLPLINQLYLRDFEPTKASFADTYSAIIALRFIADQPNTVIPREQLIESIRLVLDNEFMVDIAVFDLARYEDWDSLDRVVEIFRKSHENIYPAALINFVRMCPDPSAPARLEELIEIDAAAVKKARSFMSKEMLLNLKRHPTRLRRPHGGSVSKC